MNEVKNIIIGLEINRDNSSIAYFDREKDRPVTLSVHPGSDDGEFPTSMEKQGNNGRWYIPINEPAGAEDVFRIDDLYKVFCSAGKVAIGEKLYEPWKLMAIYIRNALEFTGVRDILDNIRGIMITSFDIDMNFADNAMKAMSELKFTPGTFFVQDHMESFYYYCISQNIDLYKKKAGVFNCTDNDVTFESLVLTRGTNPNTARIKRSAPGPLYKYDEHIDSAFRKYAEERIGEDEFSLIYINSRDFDMGRFPETGAFLSSDFRRVFAGSDLYSKGACYGALERAERNKFRNILFIGRNMLYCNVGMELLSGEKEIYYPIITAGVNWFEAGKTFVVMPHDTNRLVLKAASLDGKHTKDILIPLAGIDKRPVGTTKIRIEARCENAGRYIIEATDMGFGDMFPSSGRVIKKVLEINDDFWDSDDAELTDRKIHCRLCKVPAARTPYHIDAVGLNLYSIEEFCYFVFRYPELIDAEIVNMNIREWFRDELKLNALAQEIGAILKEDGDIMDFFEPIFREAGYLTKREQEAFKKRIKEFEKTSPMIRFKKKGDALAHYRKYSTALKAYRQAEAVKENEEENGAFMAGLYNNMGTVYMKMLRYDEASECFHRAYMSFHTREALRTWLLSIAISKPRSKYEEMIASMELEDGLKEEIDDAIRKEIGYVVPEDKRSRREILDSLIKDYHSN